MSNSENLNIDVTVDLSEFRRSMTEISQQMKNLNKSSKAFTGLANKISAVTAMGSSLIPILASASVLAGALGASALALAGGLGAVALVGVPVIQTITDTEKALASGNKSIIQANKDWTTFKETFKEFSMQFVTPISGIFSSGLTLLTNTMKELKPVIDVVLPVIQGIIDKLNAKVEGGGLQKFITFLKDNAGTSIQNFATIIGNAITGITNLFMAFQPVMKPVEDGLVTLTEKFANWSATLQTNQGFQQFLEYARTNAPVVLDALKNAFTIVIEVIKSLAPVGQVVLKALATALEWIKTNIDVLIPVVGGLAVAFGAWKTISTVIGLVKTLNTTFRTIKATMALVRTGQIMLNLAMLANPIGIVIALVAGLVAGFVIAYKKSDTFRNMVNKLWEGLKKLAGTVSGAVVKAFNGFIDTCKSLWGWIKKIVDKIANFSLGGLGDAVGKLFGGGKASVKVAPTMAKGSASMMKAFAQPMASSSGGRSTATLPKPLNNDDKKSITFAPVFNSPKALTVSEANREFQKTLNRLSLEW